MKKFIYFKLFIFAGLILFISSVLPFSALSKSSSVKTSYKRYSIFKYNNEDILCEPYIVEEGDWLYNIFQKKGELSIKNFSQFLNIFKGINPKIKNIDAIKSDIRILIPLKKVGKGEYDQRTTGNIDVPVIEFSTMPKGLNLRQFTKKHKIEKGETVSSLVDKDFFKKGGGISKAGLKALQLVNPDINNIHIIYEGDDIYLPDPSIKLEPWFKLFVSGKSAKQKMKTNSKTAKQFKLETSNLLALKKYASLVNGTLLNSGKMYFPDKNNLTGVIDLSSTPVIDTKDGSKILILSDYHLSDELLKIIQAHWKGMKIQLLSEIIDKSRNADGKKILEKNNGIIEYKKIIEIILLQTKYTYIPNSKLQFMFNSIPLEANFGRVIRKDTKDLLINFGLVYGSGLEILKRQEFKIISISPELTIPELAEKLFSNLGYATWKNPSFYSEKAIENINGLYAAKGPDKLFIPFKPLNLNAFAYLKQEGVKILSMKNKTQAQ